MTGAPSLGANELDPLLAPARPAPLVLVSPPSAVHAWFPPPAITGDLAGTTPDGAAQPARLLERLEQNCHAAPAAAVQLPGPTPGGPLEAAEKARAWLASMDVAWAPRARRRADELALAAIRRAAATPERDRLALAGTSGGEACSMETGEVYRETWSELPAGDPGPPRVVRRAFAGARPELVAGPDARVTPPAPGGWHVRRSRALARSLRERVEGCGQGAPLVIECACGRVKVPTSCGLRWLCRTCQSKAYRRLRAKLTKSMRASVTGSERAWCKRGRPARQRRWPILATLTVRHSGDLLTDRKRIQLGWERLRKWLHRRLKLEQQAAGVTEPSGKFTYALTWEVTPGEDGLGHVHAHAVVLLPFVPWDKMRAEWLRATEGHSTGIDLRAPTKKRKDGSIVRLVGEGAAAAAAEYLAKYASKGVDVAGEFTPSLAANVLDAAWGRRLCSTSHGFWLPKPRCECEACHVAWRVAEKPPKGARRPAVWTQWRCGILLVVEVDGREEERWYQPSEGIGKLDG